ncbi:hypothetical protein Celaphus_00005489, partial [Cervus elaphus hippelaphus]
MDSLKKHTYEVEVHRLLNEAEVLDHSKNPSCQMPPLSGTGAWQPPGPVEIVSETEPLPGGGCPSLSLFNEEATISLLKPSPKRREPQELQNRHESSSGSLQGW